MEDAVGGDAADAECLRFRGESAQFSFCVGCVGFLNESRSVIASFVECSEED